MLEDGPLVPARKGSTDSVHDDSVVVTVVEVLFLPQVREVLVVEGRDVLDVAVADLGLGVGPVLVQDAVEIPAVVLADGGYDASCAVLQGQRSVFRFPWYRGDG